MTANPQTLGERIAELRKARKWTQEELANRAHTSRGYIAQIERSHRRAIGHPTLCNLKHAFGISLDELIPCSEEPDQAA